MGCEDRISCAYILHIYLSLPSFSVERLEEKSGVSLKECWRVGERSGSITSQSYSSFSGKMLKHIVQILSIPTDPYQGLPTMSKSPTDGYHGAQTQVCLYDKALNKKATSKAWPMAYGEKKKSIDKLDIAQESWNRKDELCGCHWTSLLSRRRQPWSGKRWAWRQLLMMKWQNCGKSWEHLLFDGTAV